MVQEIEAAIDHDARAHRVVVCPRGMGNGATYRKPDSRHPIKSFGPMEVHPAAVQEVLALARRAGIIPEEWVADERAPAADAPSYDESADGKADIVARVVRNAPERFTLDPQRGQPIYIEVLCEAADLKPRLARIAHPYGVPVYSGAGFDGLKGKREFAERALDRDVPTIVLDIGDRDLHGDHIYIAAAEDAVAWAEDQGNVWPVNPTLDPGELEELRDDPPDAPWVIFVRLALTADQAEDLDLLDADGKAEVDGVPVPVMDEWLTEAIEALQDPARRDSLRDAQEAEREGLPGLIRDALDWDA